MIAEIKRVIPKLADQVGPDLREASLLASLYQEGGAAAISLVTEARHFGGNAAADLPAVLRAVPSPVLIKDFILDFAQVDYYAGLIKSAGVGGPGRVALLIISHLAGLKTGSLIRYIYQRGMGVLLETRNIQDLDLLEPKDYPTMIGINHRLIDQLEMDDNTANLTPETVSQYRALVQDALIISESAHGCPGDVRRSIGAGADAVLVGTAFMRAECPRAAVKSFVNCLQVSPG